MLHSNIFNQQFPNIVHGHFHYTGEILIVEKNCGSALLPKYIRLFCVVCLRRTWTPLPCSSCTEVWLRQPHAYTQGGTVLCLLYMASFYLLYLFIEFFIIITDFVFRGIVFNFTHI